MGLRKGSNTFIILCSYKTNNQKCKKYKVEVDYNLTSQNSLVYILQMLVFIYKHVKVCIYFQPYISNF